MYIIEGIVTVCIFAGSDGVNIWCGYRCDRPDDPHNDISEGAEDSGVKIIKTSPVEEMVLYPQAGRSSFWQHKIIPPPVEVSSYPQAGERGRVPHYQGIVPPYICIRMEEIRRETREDAAS